MRRILAILIAALLTVPLMAAPAVAAPGDVSLSVVHGVPDLDVDIYLDDAPVSGLQSFSYESVAGPLTVASGGHELEIFAAGSDPMVDSPALAATVEFPPGANLTAVAHLDESGDPALKVFTNDTSATAAGFGTVVVRHTAEAPAVDVLAGGTVVFADLTNPNEASAALPPAIYDITLNAAGTDTQAFPASGSAAVPVTSDQATIVYAIGSLTDGNFTVVTQTVELASPTGHALVDVVHGVPGVTVDVYANGLPLLTGFEPGDIVGQVLIGAGTYDFAIYPAGSDPLATAPVIQAPGVEVPAGANAAVVAHLDDAGTPTASVFLNDTSTIAADEARVTVRHTAEAPSVDVLANGDVLVPDLANPDEAVADVPADTYDVTLNAAGTDTQAFPDSGAVALALEEGTNTIVYAIGSLGSTFDLLVTTLPGLGVDGAFSDVADSVHKDNITTLALAGVARGYDDGSYGPDDSVTRGQMAAFLRRALSLPESATDAFADDDDSVFEGDIDAIAAYGITRGFGDGTYRPGDVLTRGQMAAFLARAFALPAGGPTPFTDTADSVFADDIAALYTAGITAGTTATTYSPNDPVTRGQMASFITRALGLG